MPAHAKPRAPASPSPSVENPVAALIELRGVDIVGPENQCPRPDHDGQNREVDPVEPTKGERVFIDGT